MFQTSSKRAAIAFLALAGFLSSCHSASSFLNIHNSRYHDLLKIHTKEARFFSLEQAKVIAHVTYRDAELRKAYVEEYAQRYELPAEERETMLAKEAEEAAKYDEFVISLYTGHRQATQLTAMTSAWRLWLKGEGQEAAVRPENVSSLSSDDPVLLYFYPHVTPNWAKVFQVRFPKNNESGPLELRAAGVIANLHFVWERAPN
jgi:hypothetical protein